MATDAGAEALRDASRGALPDWAAASPRRREHISRVAALMAEWADLIAVQDEDRARWIAAAWLHDVLRDEDPDTLRAELTEPFRSFPGSLLHGPAAAERLRGIADEELLQAIRYHTLGHPSFRTLGKALYLADFLEPGREFRSEWRAELRVRVPREMDAVLLEVVAARIERLLGLREPIRSETAAFWSSLVGAREG
ncbi:MAG: HD domain-containing protein [Gemmatimonadota bacterium]|nr:HD domain-containing protein [Gemmatimonadota bacterium]